MKFDTKVLHAAIKPDPITGSILPPLHQTATYVLEEVGKDKGFDYTRSANPTPVSYTHLTLPTSDLV